MMPGGITLTSLYRFQQSLAQRMNSAIAMNFRDLEKHVVPRSGRLVRLIVEAT
jgi:hypothetical protein